MDSLKFLWNTYVEMCRTSLVVAALVTAFTVIGFGFPLYIIVRGIVEDPIFTMILVAVSATMFVPVILIRFGLKFIRTVRRHQ